MIPLLADNDLAKEVASLLLADAALAQLVGSRIYPDRLPETPADEQAYPALRFQQISALPVLARTPQQAFHSVTVQIDAWAVQDGAEASQTVSAAARALLWGLQSASPRIDGIVAMPEPGADDLDRYTCRITFLIQYNWEII